MLRQFYLIIVFLIVSGCLTRAVQTESLLESKNDLPRSFEIKNVEFIDQSSGFCGPATLTMALRYHHLDTSVDNVSPFVFTPGAKGSFQADMISGARRFGLMAIQLNNLNDLLAEIAAGHPVIIFENLSLSWLPNWHYALAVGFDLDKKEIILHSGHDAYFHWDLRKFERSWMLGDYWGLVVLPAGELASSASELSHSAAAVALEQLKKMTEAEKSYLKILSKWPRSLVSLIGLANIYDQAGKRKDAVRILRLAVQYHPESEAARHNLKVAESK